MSPDLWRGRKVFLTGHTGFKGSWFSMLLDSLGASVQGYSLSPGLEGDIFGLAGLRSVVRGNERSDIRDFETLRAAMDSNEPEVVVHFAAQPLVRYSYDNPLETWSTNVMGTVNTLEAIRGCSSVRAVLIITTDKVYENKEWVWGYRENDALGGYDPYSASKACTELVVQSYQRSFFNTGVPLVAVARAGNVVGGGDWSRDRLIPDAARAMIDGVPLILRNPSSTRPWQHVLDALNGYIVLLERLLAEDRTCATAFNFGPRPEGNRSVIQVVAELQKYWPRLSWAVSADVQPHEANFLYLDSAKAASKLNWLPRWGFSESIKNTAEWYRLTTEQCADPRKLLISQITEYINL